MSASIRSRVVLLVLAVLLPGLAGVAWQILDTDAAESQANERTLRETSRAISQVIDSELLRRATIASVLSQSSALDGPVPLGAKELGQFQQQAQRALAGVGGWIELRTAERVLVDTRGAASAAQGGSSEGAVDGRTGASRELAQAAHAGPLWLPSAAAAASGAVPHAVIVQPVQRDGATRYEIVVTTLPAEMQRIVDAQQLPSGWVGAVLDSKGTIVARQPGGAAYVGRMATADLRQNLLDKSEGLFSSVSLDGLQTMAYFSRSPMGWAYVTGMPRAGFAGRIPETVRRVGVAALLLLALALAGALWLARGIVEPVRRLTHSVRQLQNGQAVETSATGLAECDAVTLALAEAAASIRNARVDLERQVAEAVQLTRVTEQRAAQGQRVAAVGRLTGGVAHDFNNLLGVISNSAHLIQRHPAAAELQAPLAATQRAVQMGSELTQHLLRFAGRRPLRPRDLSLAQALPEMQALLRSVLGRPINVTVQVAPDAGHVHVDASELELALINLALNARDAMPGGGELRVHARNADAEDLSGVSGLLPGRYVAIGVSDDGVGVAPDVAAHAFEPFFTTKAVGQGSGLGLSQVHGFCTQAGGAARLDSTPGLGTTVTLLLPASGPSEPIGAPISQAQPAGDPVVPTSHDIVGARVLLVEDNQTLADVTAALLASHGARVRRAANGMQALQLVEEGTVFDVVLSDLVMPGTIDGLTLARRLRGLRPKLPVVLITAFSHAAAEAAESFTVLRKPCPQPELLRALHRALNGR